MKGNPKTMMVSPTELFTAGANTIHEIEQDIQTQRQAEWNWWFDLCKPNVRLKLPECLSVESLAYLIKIDGLRYDHPKLYAVHHLSTPGMKSGSCIQ